MMLDEKFVFTNGCFDILHRGHVELLQYCKSIGYVVVGLNSDESIHRLKGPSRPINNQNDRRDVLLSLRCVDAVIIFDEDTPYQLIQRLSPDVIVKGGDYRPEDVVGRDMAPVRIFNSVPGYSTTSLIERASNR